MISLSTLKLATVPAAVDPDPEVQRVWFELAQHPWGSLAIVPAAPSIAVAQLAEQLCAAAELEGSRFVQLLDARGTAFPRFQRVAIALSAGNESTSILVPVDDVGGNPTALAIARATSAVIIVVRFGESRLTATRKLIETLGRDRVIGCVVLAAD